MQREAKPVKSKGATMRRHFTKTKNIIILTYRRCNLFWFLLSCLTGKETRGCGEDVGKHALQRYESYCLGTVDKKAAYGHQASMSISLSCIRSDTRHKCSYVYSCVIIMIITIVWKYSTIGAVRDSWRQKSWAEVKFQRQRERKREMVAFSRFGELAGVLQPIFWWWSGGTVAGYGNYLILLYSFPFPHTWRDHENFFNVFIFINMYKKSFHRH